MTPPTAGSRSYKAARSLPTPCGAAGAILKDDTVRCQLVADAVGSRGVRSRLGVGAIGDLRVDAGIVAAAEPCIGALAEQPEQRRAASQDRRIGNRPEARECKRRVEVVAQRVNDALIDVAG